MSFRRLRAMRPFSKIGKELSNGECAFTGAMLGLSDLPWIGAVGVFCVSAR
jgi:hypothetical protein